MKQCPTCKRTYSDSSISFCLEDGALLSAPFSTQAGGGRAGDPAPTLVMPIEQPARTQPAIGSDRQSTITALNVPVHTAEKSTATAEAPSTVSRRWQIQITATSFLALFAIVGIALYGLPFYYDYMVRELGLTRTQVTSGNALSKLVVGPLFGYFAGWIVDRFGPRRLMLVGILMAGAALIGLGNMSALWMFYFFYLLNALGYVCAGPLPNQVLLSRWFDKSRGKAMGIAYLGIGLGGAIVFQLSAQLTRIFGWHVSLSVLGVLIIVIAFPLAFFVKESPLGTPTGLKAAARPEPIGWVLGSPEFYLLMIGSMCSIGAVGGTNQHLKLLLASDLHFTDQQVANVASLVLVSSLIGRLLMGWLADHFAKKYVMLLIYFIVAIGISLLFFATVPGVIYLFAVVFGIGLGGDYMIIPLMAGELFGVKILGRLMGIVLTADGVAEALAPLLVGKMRDQMGEYGVAFAVLLALALIGSVAIVLLPKKASARVA
ncbi:MAG TPA: MFS transporter [Pyrinomonadaceae bacterium]|nr:MFS transporter [Pyrinomonadaceae bacterium]